MSTGLVSALAPFDSAALRAAPLRVNGHLFVALVLLAASAAQAQVVGNTFGWTKDGRYFVYSNPGGEDQESEPGHFVVLDSRTGQSQAIAGSELEDPEIGAFLKKHPLVGKEAKSNPVSPDGKSKADVVPSAGDEGAWTGAEWSSGGGTAWDLKVNGKRAAFGVGGSSIRVFFSPDGKRTVWIISHPGTTMRDVGSDDVILGTDGSPSVGVAADKAKLDAAQKVAAKLEKAGATIISITAAKKARTESVVYAATGFEETAKQLAAQVPGGATVAKLDWPSSLDVVVALAPAGLEVK